MHISIELPHSEIIESVDDNFSDIFRRNWYDNPEIDDNFRLLRHSRRLGLMTLTFPNQVSENIMRVFFENSLAHQRIYFFSVDVLDQWSFSTVANFSQFCDIFYEISPVTEAVVIGDLNGHFLYYSFTDITSFGVDHELAKSLICV